MQSWGDVEAFNEGLRVGLRAEAETPAPYPESSPRFMAWRDGWEVGHKSRSSARGEPARSGVTRMLVISLAGGVIIASALLMWVR